MRNCTNYSVVRASKPLARNLVTTDLATAGQNADKKLVDTLTRSVYNALRRQARSEKIII
jgi:hypothetical protein